MMIEDALNRFGILLTFASGFLLSPQLIGVARIATFERWSEDRLQRLSKTAQKVIPKLIHYERLNGAVVFVYYMVLLLAAVVVSQYLDNRFGHDRAVRFALLFAVVVTVGPWATILLFLVATRRAAELIVRKLEGDDRLLSVLTTAGVFIFIIGNGLQFAATFHPKHIGLPFLHIW